jgi:membrane-bound inhibitor of C-type lysozyme
VGEENLKRTTIVTAVTLLAMAAGGCSGGWWPFGRSGDESNRIPSGATEYVCAEGKRLIVRFDDGAKSAWVFLPDREFRLQQSGSSDRYSNGISTLSLQGDNVHLDSEGIRQFADCKRKSS